MSRGLGLFQLSALEAIKLEMEDIESDDFIHLYWVKRRLFGDIDGGIIKVKGRGEVRLRSRLKCTSSQAANLNRAIDSLAERGLVKVYGPRQVGITDKGDSVLSEYKSKLFT